jgi:hypothetical protein
MVEIPVGNLAAVCLAQPRLVQAESGETVSRAIYTQPIASVPTLEPALTTPLETVRWLNPKLATSIALIREPKTGVPREQMTLPIAPRSEVTDEMLFEATTGATFYLPRYRVAERNQQVQVSFASSAQGWALTLDLEKYPAPVLQETARTAQELAHSISVILQHRLTPEEAAVGQKEWMFQEITAEGAGMRAVLQVPSIAERDLLYQVLTNPAYAAVLIVRRTAQVGIPLSENARTSSEIVSSGTGTIRGTWTFSFDTGVEGGGGDVWWEQETQVLRKMVPRGVAQMVWLGVRDFDAITLQDLQGLAYSQESIDGSVVHWVKKTPGPIVVNRLPPLDRKIPRIGGAMAIDRRDQTARPIDLPIPIDKIRRPPIVIDDGNTLPKRSNFLTNGTVFAVRTNNGNFAKVQVLSYGYDLQMQWVTYTPKQEPRFRAVTRVLDVQSDRTPFVFPPNLHPYIFKGISGSNTTFQLDWRPANGRSYYQDPAQRHVFYYLPDSFKLVRRPERPHYPMLSIQFHPVGNSDEVQVSIAYWAYPDVSAARLATDALVLRQFLPAGVTNVEFQPLAANHPRLFLGLPQPDGSLIYQERPEVLVDLRNGFRDSRTVSLAAFQSIYDAIFSPTTQLFQGQVQVSLLEGQHTEIIPFIAQMDDLVGEIFDYTQEIDPASGAIRATFRNAIESPIRLDHISAKVKGETTQVDGVIALLSASLPVELKPGESLLLGITPASAIAGTPEVVFDLSGVEVLADSKAIWEVIVLPQSTMTYKREIKVRTTDAVFGDRIQVISIDLKAGTAVDFLKGAPPEQLTVATNVVTPIRDLILREADSGVYEYRALVILNDGKKAEDPANQWRSASSESLWITNTELPPLL